MSKEKLAFQNLLTWEDIIQLGDPIKEKFAFLDSHFLHLCCSHGYSKAMFDSDLVEFFQQPFLDKFPEFPFSINNFDLVTCFNIDENGQWVMKVSKPHFFVFLLKECLTSDFDQSKEDKLLATFILGENNLLERVEEYLKHCKKIISEKIQKYDTNNSNQIKSLFDARVIGDASSRIEDLVNKRRNINWCIRNLKQIFEFIDKSLDLRLFEAVDKDLFIFQMASAALKESKVLEFLNDEISENELFDSANQDRTFSCLNYLNNYKLMISYLNQENGTHYSKAMPFELSDGGEFIVTSDTLIETLAKFEKSIDDSDFKQLYESRNGKYLTYVELLSDKANQTWKKLQNEKLVKSIKLSWELIPTSEKVSLHNYRKESNVRIVANSEKSQMQLKKAYDLVEEKMDYFSSSNPLFELTGINTFEGYSAYMYSNGVVVFEKFFKPKTVKGKNGSGSKQVISVPVAGEAIYVMNFKNFADLSKYTKMELIEESAYSSDIRRIYHTADGSWKTRLDLIINGSGYGSLDLEEVDQIAKELSLGKNGI